MQEVVQKQKAAVASKGSVFSIIVLISIAFMFMQMNVRDDPNAIAEV